jgi:hypothetical protein
MPKILIEYNGIPAIIEHNLESVKKIKFIVTYKSENGLYYKEEFNTLDEAIEFEPDNEIKFVFVYITSIPDENNLMYAIHKFIQFSNNKLVVTSDIKLTKLGYTFEIDFAFENFRIRKRKSNLIDNIYDLKYTRRRTIKSDNKTEFELLDSYYELVPRYEDIFLEVLFFYDISSRNSSLNEKTEIEAYYLQAKIRIDKFRNPPVEESTDVEDQPTISTELVTLEGLIGLQKVKLEIQELKSLAKFRQKRIELGLPVTPTTLHIVFTGNPGTGKTTVARLLGQIYFDIGLLLNNNVVESARQDLVGEYLGQTALKTQDLFESAIGGILFIDEAYSLFRLGDNFGKEAIETLLKLMEDNRERIVVILAGYPKEMEDLINSNPGLRARFSKIIHFDDYSKEELLEIFLKMVSDYNNSLTEGAKFKIEHLIEANYDTGAFTSNARTVRNIFEETVKLQSLRLSVMENPSQDELTSFIDKDLPNTII